MDYSKDRTENFENIINTNITTRVRCHWKIPETGEKHIFVLKRYSWTVTIVMQEALINGNGVLAINF